MPKLTAQRLLALQAMQARIYFTMDEGSTPVPPMMMFASGWAMPLVAAYARAVALTSLGAGATALLQEQRRSSAVSPLGEEVTVGIIDGSAAGLLRAALLSYAAQEALGFRWDAPGLVDWDVLVQGVMLRPHGLASQLLRARSEADLAGVLARHDIPAPDPATLTAAPSLWEQIVPFGGGAQGYWIN